ncbi:gluconate 2-dehydrogenase subunit 3 family protein [Halovenus sp. HT40]|uniref:gluconate 2-dehydrogenase subunit 3 family protein n=1 Tax=Halovenus sp. HT40 TaxID=3126691 RepID=UPI00300EAD4E
MTEHMHLDRRTFVRLAGAGGVAAVAGCQGGEEPAEQDEESTTDTPPEDSDDSDGPEYTFFDDQQAATVTSVVDRLLPPGEDRPAASEIGVVRYIDRALTREPFYETAHDDRRFQDAYESGLAKLDETAQSMFESPVRELDDEQLDELIGSILDRSAPEWEDVPTASAVTMTVPAEAFVTVLRDHAVEGYYSQPKYGGNVDLAGWKQAGYVGPFVEGYRPDELKPPWKSLEEHEAEKTRPSDLYGEFGGESDA